MYLTCIYVLLLVVVQAVRDVHDPLNIFCGPANCYEILGIERASSLSQIKTAYRQLSISHHPDKNQNEAQDSTVKFQEIAKAYEVLKGNESRPLFDYYLDHPWDYFKVSGRHMMRSMPKASIATVVIGVLVFLSAILYYVQLNNYRETKKYLEDAVLKNLGPKNGGSKYTVDLFESIAEKYNQQVQQSKDLITSSKKKAKKAKVAKASMLEDPMFRALVTSTVDAIKIEGGNKKPTFDDLLIMKLLKLPFGGSSSEVFSAEQVEYYQGTPKQE